MVAGLGGRQEEVIRKVLERIGDLVNERGRKEEARQKREGEREEE